MNAEDWITYSMPSVPEADPCDHRVTSAPVLIQTIGGAHYTAQWVVYTDQYEDGIPPCWELCGREGLQLDREDVVAWMTVSPYRNAP